MKLVRTGIIAAAVLSVASVAFAQAPDFSGSWTVDTAAMPAPPAGAAGAGRGAGGRGMAGPMVVTQTKDTLTIERTMGANKVTQTYKLDGTESVNKVTRGRGENATEVETKSTAKWDGTKLVITTQSPGQGGEMMSSTQTWYLEGGTLVVEQPGREGAVRKTVYKKTT
jgi:hypothetical protein